MQRRAGLSKAKDEVDGQPPIDGLRLGDHLASFDGGQADRLLAEDVTTRFQRVDRHRQVKEVGRRDADDVELLGVEHLAVIGVASRNLVARRAALEEVLVEVDQRHDLGRGVRAVPLDVVAADAQTDDADAKLVHHA